MAATKERTATKRGAERPCSFPAALCEALPELSFSSIKYYSEHLSIRQKRGLTQAQFAKLMGTSQQAVSRIESGEYEGFTLRTLKKIAEATGTKLKIDFVAA